MTFYALRQKFNLQNRSGGHKTHIGLNVSYWANNISIEVFYQSYDVFPDRYIAIPAGPHFMILGLYNAGLQEIVL